VLEVGGGTASATSYLVAALERRIAEYLFTDLGASFVSAARQEFRNVPFMRFQTLDLESAPAEQGLDGEFFDVIIASNVVHATSDLRQTLSRIASLLAPGGILLMAETLAGQPWIDMTVGITEGWWRFTDLELRPRYPLVDKQSWMALLAEVGFHSVIALPDEEPGILSSQLIFAAVRRTGEHDRKVSSTTSVPQVLIIKSGALDLPHPFAELLAIEASKHGARISIVSSDTRASGQMPVRRSSRRKSRSPG